MSLNALGLGFMFTATDLASGVMGNIKKNFQGLEDAANTKVDNLDKLTRRMGAGLMGAAAGIGGLAASFNMAKRAGDFEKAMVQVQIKTNATEKELASLRAAALDMGQTLGVAPVEAAMGMKLLAQQGYNNKEILEMLPTVSKFATAGQIELGEAIDLTSQAMRGFNIDSNLMTRALDQMTKVADMSSADVADLPLGLSRALSGAQQYGATLTDTIGLFAAVKDVLHSIQVSGTGVSIVMSRLARPKYGKLLEQMLPGVHVTDKSTGQLRDIIDVLGDMIPQLEKLSQTEQANVFEKVFGGDGTKGMTALLARVKKGWVDAEGMTRTGIDGLRYSIDQIAEADGVLDQASEKLLSTFNKKIDKLTATADRAGIALGEPFLKVWMPVLDSVTNGLTAFATTLEKMDPDVAKWIATIMTGAAALLTLVSAVALGAAIWPLLKVGFVLVGKAIWGIVMAIGPLLLSFGWMLPLVIGVGVAIAAMVNRVGDLGTVWDRIVNAFSGTKGVFESVGKFFSNAWEQIVIGFNAVFKNVPFDEITDAFHDLMDSVSDLLSEFGLFDGDGTSSMFRDIGRAIGAVAGFCLELVGGFARIGQIVTDVVHFVIKPAIFLLYGLLIGWWLEPLSKITGLFKGIEGTGERLLQWVEKPQVRSARETGWTQNKRDMQTLGDSLKEVPGSGDWINGQEILKRRRSTGGMSPSDSNAQAAAQSASLGQYAGTELAVNRKNLIDYDRLAEAVASLAPPTISIDGERLAVIIDRARERRAQRASWG